MRRVHRRIGYDLIRVSHPHDDAFDFILRGVTYVYSARSKWICRVIHSDNEMAHRLKERLIAAGKSFDKDEELNAYAAKHEWPNWIPVSPK